MKRYVKLLALLFSAVMLITALPLSLFAAAGGWNTDLTGLTSTTNKPAKITYHTAGVTLTRTHENDGLAISKTKTAGDFIFESDVTFDSGNVANLIFGAQNQTSSQESFIFKFDRHNRAETKIFVFSDAKGFPTVASNNGNSYPMDQSSYHMKVLLLDGTCAVYVDEVLVCSTKLPEYYRDGFLGIGAAEGSTVTFQNTEFTDLGKKQLAKIENIEVENSVLTPEYTDTVTAYGVLAVSNRISLAWYLGFISDL
ncbi:MAG: hypothetical protein IKC63_08235 [Clostridia bacterium]|nr:hypothetical protein [Clostridia bacterium]